MHGVKINFSLKNELKKKEFIMFFKDKLSNVDCDAQLYDILLLLIRSAEDHFHKPNKKLGHVKKEAVISTIRLLLKKQIDELTLVNMIDSICLNNDNLSVQKIF